jgi:TRAP-type C4-dicarboxylate transport system substrate-binding protein
MAVLGVNALGAARAWAQGVVIRAIGSGAVRRTTAAAVERLVRGVAEASHGRVRIAVEPDAASTTAVIEHLRGGEADLGWVRLAEIGDLVPAVAALSVPFLFRDPQKAVSILDEAALGPLLNDQLRKQGLEPLGFLNAGALRLAGAAPPSLKGLGGQRILARPGILREVAFKALGLELVPGVPAADQAGAAPLAELRTDDLAGDAQGWRAVADMPHAYDLVVFCANRERFGAFFPDIREMLLAHVREVAVWQRGGTVQADAAALAILQQRGIELATLPEEELRQAHERVKAAMAEALRGADPSIVRTVLAYAG